MSNFEENLKNLTDSQLASVRESVEAEHGKRSVPTVGDMLGMSDHDQEKAMRKLMAWQAPIEQPAEQSAEQADDSAPADVWGDIPDQGELAAMSDQDRDREVRAMMRRYRETLSNG